MYTHIVIKDMPNNVLTKGTKLTFVSYGIDGDPEWYWFKAPKKAYHICSHQHDKTHHRYHQLIFNKWEVENFIREIKKYIK